MLMVETFQMTSTFSFIFYYYHFLLFLFIYLPRRAIQQSRVISNYFQSCTTIGVVTHTR